MPAKPDPSRLVDHALSIDQAAVLIGRSDERVRVWCNTLGPAFAYREGPQFEWRIDPLSALLTAYFIQGRQRVDPAELRNYLGSGSRREMWEIIRSDEVWRERFAELWATNVREFLAQRRRRRGGVDNAPARGVVR